VVVVERQGVCVCVCVRDGRGDEGTWSYRNIDTQSVEMNSQRVCLITKQSLQYQHYSNSSRCKGVERKGLSTKYPVTVTVLYKSSNTDSRKMNEKANRNGKTRIYCELVGAQYACSFPR
jgi:hypothetical protein